MTLRSPSRGFTADFFWNAEAQHGASNCNTDQFLIAATSRSFDRGRSEACFCSFLTAANSQVTGRRRGGQLGLVGFLADAACFYGATFG